MRNYHVYWKHYHCFLKTQTPDPSSICLVTIHHPINKTLKMSDSNDNLSQHDSDCHNDDRNINTSPGARTEGRSPMTPPPIVSAYIPVVPDLPKRKERDLSKSRSLSLGFTDNILDQMLAINAMCAESQRISLQMTLQYEALLKMMKNRWNTCKSRSSKSPPHDKKLSHETESLENLSASTGTVRPQHKEDSLSKGSNVSDQLNTTDKILQEILVNNRLNPQVTNIITNSTPTLPLTTVSTLGLDASSSIEEIHKQVRLFDECKKTEKSNNQNKDIIIPKLNNNMKVNSSTTAQWDNHVALQWSCNFDLKITEVSLAPNQGISFNIDGYPVDKATTPHKVWDRWSELLPLGEEEDEKVRDSETELSY
jgi:hypothetical protein